MIGNSEKKLLLINNKLATILIFIISILSASQTYATGLTTLDFIVPNSDGSTAADRYTNTLVDIRDNWAPIVVSGDVHRLEDNPSVPYFILGLSVDGKRVDFYISSSNLYVVGFRIGNTYYALQGEGYGTPSFQGNEEVTISNLGFSGDYLSLERTSGTSRSSLNYNIGSLTSALYSEINTPNDSNAATLLLTVIPMFIEGARFIPSIGHDIAENIRNSTPSPISARDQSIMNSWSLLSSYYEHALNDPNTSSVNVGGTTYTTAAQVAALISIILVSHPR